MVSTLEKKTNEINKEEENNKKRDAENCSMNLMDLFGAEQKPSDFSEVIQ